MQAVVARVSDLMVRADRNTLCRPPPIFTACVWGVKKGVKNTPPNTTDTNEPVEELVSLERKAMRRRSIRSGIASGEISRVSPFLNDKCSDP
ncbi:hypothetical protein niasHT_036253 [Heterodera trifolii]|uniref:Uncharacterized protein n=1 Tax=Heterodera trifolii TaxID=157864 RepID=A0ABD2I2F6_9BILA